MTSRDRWQDTLRRAVPAAEWLPRWRVNWKRDAVAALAVWAVLVPQSMAYATLAGVPPVYGLYAAIVGLVLYGLLGTSRELNVGPSSSVAVMTAATVAPLAAGDGETYVALSAALALVTGLILVVGGLTRLGFVAEFLARPVLAGYFIGLALTIVVTQLPALLGIPGRHGRVLREGVGPPRRGHRRSAGGPPPSGSRRSLSCSSNPAIRAARPRGADRRRPRCRRESRARPRGRRSRARRVAADVASGARAAGRRGLRLPAHPLGRCRDRAPRLRGVDRGRPSVRPRARLRGRREPRARRHGRRQRRSRSHSGLSDRRERLAYDGRRRGRGSGLSSPAS